MASEGDYGDETVNMVKRTDIWNNDKYNDIFA